MSCGTLSGEICILARRLRFSLLDVQVHQDKVKDLAQLFVIFLAKVSFLRRKTNITQAPGQDTPRCVTLGGLYTAAERIQPAEQEQRPGGGVGVGCGVLARREGGAGVFFWELNPGHRNP